MTDVLGVLFYQDTVYIQLLLLSLQNTLNGYIASCLIFQRIIAEMKLSSRGDGNHLLVAFGIYVIISL